VGKTGIREDKIAREQNCSSPRRAGRLQPRGLLLAAGVSLGCALLLAGCEHVQGYSPVSLVRVIDASYNAPALNVYVAGNLVATNLGQGQITPYGTYSPSPSAKIVVTSTKDTNPLVSTTGTLQASQSSSVLITDINATYQATLLEDQSTPAPSGHSEFRVLNQAPSTGPIDVYFLAGTTATDYAAAKPVITSLAVGATSGYVTIPSSTLYMVIVAAGTTLTTSSTSIYVSAALPLVGGEVRTVLVVDPLVTTQPVQVYIATDAD
jgi:hypothetical protein